MSLRVELLPDASGLALAGRIDHADAADCEARGLALIASLPAGRNVLACDLSGLESGSSVTAAVLMSWQRAAGRAGRQLVLQNIPARLRAILQASNLLAVFEPT